MRFRCLLKWVWNLLASWRKLVSENVQRLLRSLTKATRKVAANIEELLRKVFNFIFAHAPVAVAKAMVDFNRWIVEVLADTRSEGIEWEPSYGENPWLALEEQPQNPPLEEDIAVDDAHTIHLLKAIAEFYMVRCDSLLDTNTSLALQVDELKSQLKNALTQAFESQHVVEHQQELLQLQMYRHLIGVQSGGVFVRQNPFSGASAGVQAQIRRNIVVTSSDAVEDCEATAEFVPADEPAAPDEAEDIHSGTSSVKTLSPIDPVDSGENQPHEVDEELSPSEDRLSSLTVVSQPSQPAALESIPVSGGVSYRQLTKMRTSDQDGSWLRETLRVLQEERQQRQHARTHGGRIARSSNAVSNSSEPNIATPPLHDIRPEPMEFEQLVAIRDPTQADEDSKWYSSTLSHLRRERQRRSSIRSRVASFSSTITI